MGIGNKKEKILGNGASGRLYVVATPIGNMRDITLRALDILKEVEAVACEDTRSAGRLLSHYGISGKKLVPYHQYNEKTAFSRIIAILKRGASVALVSDAGTPGISDPGFLLASKAKQAGIDVVPIPGASALTACISAAGLPSSAILFVGFLPRKKSRLKRLREIYSAAVNLPATVVFYEAPHRLAKLLGELSSVFEEDAVCSLCKELTKTYECIVTGTISEIKDMFVDADAAKGEFVVCVYPHKIGR